MLLPCLAAWAALGASPADARPNLITVVTDDQGRWAMGAYGNDEVVTPNMDRLAAEGARFTNAIAATPVCSPSRATWLTGRYASELGIADWISPSEAGEGVGLDAETWAEALRRAGYRTGLVGKWHLGEAPRFHPTAKGFEHFLGFLAGGSRPMGATLEVEGEKKRLEGPLPDRLVDDAIRFLEAADGRPFALALHFRAPHLPYGPVPAEDSAPFADLDPTIPDFAGLDVSKVKASTRAYYASIHSVDRNLGRLLDALERLQLAETTIVLFTSDHGYNEGRHGINTKGNGHWIVGGRSGPKRPNMWETSLAIPLVVRWPGVVKPGGVIDAPVSTLDAYRSVLGMCGVGVPDGSGARGIDWSPLLRGEETRERAVLFGQYDLHNYGLAYLRMARGERYKLVRHFHERGSDELYDLESDPDESRNLLRGGLDDEGRAALEDLRARLDGWMESIEDPLLRDDY